MPLGITMINMYCDLINDKFAPLFEEIARRNRILSDELERQVKIDFGIYDLFEEKAALELRIEEIEEKLKKYTHRKYDDHGHRSLIDREVQRRMNKIDNFCEKVQKARDEAKTAIKMAGVAPDVLKSLENAFKSVEDFTVKFKSLPPITDMLSLISVSGQKKRKPAKTRKSKG